MKKHVHFSICFSLVTSFTTAQTLNIGHVNMSFEEGSNEKNIIQQNKITKELVYSYSFKNNVAIDSVLTNTYYYDTAGNLTQSILAKIKNYDESVTKYENEYTIDGRLRRQVENKINLGMISIFEYDYDNNGNETNKYIYDKDTTRLTIEQKIYNEKGLVSQLLTKINANDFYISRKYYYDNDDNLIRTDAFDKKGEAMYSYIYEYDKKLNKKAVYKETENGRKIEGIYFYNTNNLCIKAFTTAKAATAITIDNTEYETFKQKRENIYNSDNTLFETNVLLDGQKVQMNRHYYSKN